MRFILLAAACLLSACTTLAPALPSAAAPTAAALPTSSDTSLDPGDAPAGAYTLDSRHASVIWRIRHMGLGIYAARFDTVSGTLSFDPRNPVNSTVSVTIAANSVSTGLLSARGERGFDRDIAENVFDAEEHPNITFTSRSIELTGPVTGRITGDLTMRGQTRPVTLEASFEGGRFVQFFGKHVIAFSARTVIDRSQWGAAFANPIIDGTTGNQVEILISAEFGKD